MKHNVAVIFSNYCRLVHLVTVLPVSTPSAERSFSVLKIVLTRLRTTLSDEYLSRLLNVSLNKSISKNIQLDKIVEAFVASSGVSRRLPI